MRRGVALVGAVVVLGACQSGGGGVTIGSGAATTTTAVGAPPSAPEAAGRYRVKSIGASFDLPEPFRDISDTNKDLLFKAQSSSPRALITIDADSSVRADRAQRDGEQFTEQSIEGHRVLVISNAQLKGLSASMQAYEAVVENGSKSFSVIMSGAVEVIDDFWATFLNSLRISG